MESGDPANEVQKLTGSETGRWQVTTEDAVYVIDLDEQTVTKSAMPNTAPGANERGLSLRALHVCWVGDLGFWTMKPDGPSPTIEYYWYLTTVIHQITRLPNRS
jgi:hypothetical protein